MTDRAQLDETAAFLRLVLPERRDQEAYRIEVFPRPDSFANNFVNIEKMAAHLLRHGRKPFNAYFALATFPLKGRDRKQEHALRFGVVWADLDCGEKKPFETRDDAIDRLASFPLVASAIVESGRGLHVYWKLAVPVEGDERPQHLDLVKGLASLLGGDPAATLGSQILRVPGTWNVDSIARKKDGKDYPVRLLRCEPGAKYSLGDFIEAGVRPTSATEPKPALAGRVPMGERHTSLRTEALRLRNLGYDADEIDGVLQVINRKRCAEGGVPEDEVRALSDWAAGLKPRAARQLVHAAAVPSRGPIHVA